MTRIEESLRRCATQSATSAGSLATSGTSSAGGAASSVLKDLTFFTFWPQREPDSITGKRTLPVSFGKNLSGIYIHFSES